MKIETKYSIGQKLFYIDWNDNQSEVKLGEVKEINFGGRSWEKYTIAWNKTRSEADLYTSFEEAQRVAIIKQKKINQKMVEIITEQKQPTRLD